jgi:DNA-binding beta-propeller fold protein YncE
MGVPNETWGQVVSATVHDAATLVDVITVQPDLPARTRSVEGLWRLPTLGRDALPVGVSADGSTVVLVEDGADADVATTRFAVVTNGEATRIIELPGAFEYDGMAPDGSILFVVEHLPSPPDAHYRVRAVDVLTGLLRDEVIVDKRNLDAAMGGWPITQLRHDEGMVFTLYRGTDHTFIHALNSREAWAICLGLPMVGADDDEAAQDWGLGQTADGRVVYAVNATLGLVVAIDPGELSIKATARFDAPRAAAGISLAKFGHQETGPVGRRVLLSPDGSTIYAAGAGGIVRVRADDLALGGHVLEGAAVDALAMTPDGAFLYALLPDDGRIVKIDLSSGRIVGSVPGDGFDRLVAIVPW